MGEARRRSELRQATIGEHIGLRPGEPMVLKFFGWRGILDLAAKIPQGLDEEAQEQVVAFRTVAASATSDNPLQCVICRDPTIYPSLMGYARTASKSPHLVVMVVCEPCSSAAQSAEELRANILEALGEVELKTSDWAS
jgi:hypothetical protein